MSSIEWTNETWNPVTGCTKVSAGCKNCYAETVAKRFWGDRPFSEIHTFRSRLDQPLHWRKPRRVFVNSMSDLFHEDVPDEFIRDVFIAMAAVPRHTFQVLTKRPERMRSLISSWDLEDDFYAHWYGVADSPAEVQRWPLPNVWLGVSAENQETADKRIPILLDTPAAVRFVSAEPLLGPIDFSLFVPPMSGPGWVSPYRPVDWSGESPLDWIIVGGESGPGARPCDVKWIHDIVEQCKTAGVPVFVKQLGAHAEYPGLLTMSGPRQGKPYRLPLKSRKGANPDEWPEPLRVREFPL